MAPARNKTARNKPSPDLPSAMPDPTLENLVDFPSVFRFRVMGDAEDTLLQRCTDAVSDALDRPPQTVSSRESSGGRYLAIRLSTLVETADEIRSVYAALRVLRGVKVVL